MKKIEVGSDGKTVSLGTNKGEGSELIILVLQHHGNPEYEWAKWFVQLSGTIMSTWNAAEMDEAARNNRTVSRLSLSTFEVLS